MADTKVVVSAKDSEARVAYDLMVRILNEENKSDVPRKDILDLYAECLSAAHGHRNYKPNK